MLSTVYACQKNMTPLKCVHLNSVTRLILITILVSIFSQSFDCKPTNSVAIEIFSEPIDPPITTDKPSITNDTEVLGVKRAVHPPDDQQYQTTSVPLLSISESETVNENNNVSISLTMEPTEIKGTPEMLTLSIAPNMLKRENQQYQTTSVSSLSTSKSESVNGNNNVSINPTTTSASTTRRLYDLKEMDLPTTMAVDTCIDCTRLV